MRLSIHKRLYNSINIRPGRDKQRKGGQLFPYVFRGEPMTTASEKIVVPAIKVIRRLEEGEKSDFHCDRRNIRDLPPTYRTGVNVAV